MYSEHSLTCSLTCYHVDFFYSHRKEFTSYGGLGYVELEANPSLIPLRLRTKHSAVWCCSDLAVQMKYRILLLLGICPKMAVHSLSDIFLHIFPE